MISIKEDGWEPWNGIRVRIHIDAEQAGPFILESILDTLEAIGAKIHGQRMELPKKTKAPINLDGLHVYIGTTTWVRPEEANRWKEAIK